MHRYAHLCQNQTELKRFDAFGFHVKNRDLWEQQTLFLKKPKEKVLDFLDKVISLLFSDISFLNLLQLGKNLILKS